VPTDIARASRPSSARSFALRGAAWSLALFGVMRLHWFEVHAVLPLTHLQAWIAASGFGTPALPIQVTLACSGADALALCVGAILAYPVLWQMRLAGAAGGTALILALNTVRIGTLGRAVGSPGWFEALHVYVWPALITLAIAGYVFTWMRYADGDATLTWPRSSRPAIEGPEPAMPTARVTRTFVWLTVAFLGVFTAASPLYLDSAAVLAVAAFVARAAAVALNVVGIQAGATGNLLSTARGAFVVTQECISTPLIPVYLAAVFAAPGHWRRRALALAALVPLFVALGIARLLVVALPSALIGSPLFLVHAFYQLLLAAVLVTLMAMWRHGVGAPAGRRALAGILAGAVLAYLLGPASARAVAWAFADGMPLADPQAAIAFLPAFQVGFYLALSLAAFGAFTWRPLLAGLAVLGVSQVTAVAALHFLVRHSGIAPHVRDVRAWAIAGPLLLIVALVTYARPRR
jgi:exosortase/archaeosortase family protein